MMGDRAEEFLSSFNRIEKWFREQLNNPTNMGFSEMVRRLSRKKTVKSRFFKMIYCRWLNCEMRLFMNRFQLIL